MPEVKRKRARLAAACGTGDGAYAVPTRTGECDGTLAMADSGTKARSNATTMGRAMKMDATAWAEGCQASRPPAPDWPAAGRGAVDTAQVPLQVAQTGTDLMSRGYSTSIQGNERAGNLYGLGSADGGKETECRRPGQSCDGRKVRVQRQEHEDCQGNRCEGELALSAASKDLRLQRRYRKARC